MVDFDEPYCDHETMEESAWLDIRERIGNAMVDEAVEIAAKDLLKPPEGIKE
jgi:hypothetical protein